MRLTDADLRQLHAELTTPPDRSQCLSEELILRGGEGRLSAPEKEKVANHIARCAECAREYRVAVSMRPLLDAAPRPRPTWGYAVAATLFLLLLPLAWLAIRRQQDAAVIAGLREELRARPAVVAAPPSTTTDAPQQIAEAVRPHLDAPIVDLDTDVVRGGSAPVPKIVVPKTAGVFTMILHLDEPFRGPVELTIEGPVTWRGTWSATEASPLITMTLQRSQFPAGQYIARASSGKRTASFRFRVEYQE